jgi:hypothetical protein
MKPISRLFNRFEVWDNKTNRRIFKPSIGYIQQTITAKLCVTGMKIPMIQVDEADIWNWASSTGKKEFC